MGIYPQPNPWQCGPFALKHGLLVLGLFEDENEIGRIAGTDHTGTDEAELSRAARRLGCELLMERHGDPEAARLALLACLHRGVPTLLCIDEWSHWVAAVAAEDDHFVLFDSHHDAVLCAMPWERLRDLWAYRGSIEGWPAGGTVYDLHPLVPLRPTWARARFSRARVQRLQANRPLARTWDRYVTDLLAACATPARQLELLIPLGTVLTRYDSQIVAAAGVTDRAAVRQVLRNFEFVAETYGLGVRPEHERRAATVLGSRVARHAAAARAGASTMPAQPPHRIVLVPARGAAPGS